MAHPSSHIKAVLQALLVTFLWSTSFVIIKRGLEDIPALTFAALRYSLAFGVILAMAWRSGQLVMVRNLPRRDWQMLAFLGVICYTITQGTQFLALEKLPATTLSLMLNFSAIAVAFIGIFFLAERPYPLQWFGVAIFVIGVLVYFYPLSFPEAQVIGLVFGVISVVANSVSAVLGRYINREAHLPAQVVTLVSMGIGSFLLLIAAILTQGLPDLSLTNWLIVLWLAVVNTAFTFTLWNHTMRVLSAVESSVINNTMLIQIGLLAWIFLDEAISLQEGIGMIVSMIGILVVQIRFAAKVDIRVEAVE